MYVGFSATWPLCITRRNEIQGVAETHDLGTWGQQTSCKEVHALVYGTQCACAFVVSDTPSLLVAIAVVHAASERERESILVVLKVWSQSERTAVLQFQNSNCGINVYIFCFKLSPCFLLGNSRRLNFICRRFGTLWLFHLHRRIGLKNY